MSDCRWCLLTILNSASQLTSKQRVWLVFSKFLSRLPQLWPPVYLWFAEDEAALSENGVNSVSELSQPDSGHCDDEAQPGTPACTSDMKPELQLNPCFSSYLAWFSLCANHHLIYLLHLELYWEKRSSWFAGFLLLPNSKLLWFKFEFSC